MYGTDPHRELTSRLAKARAGDAGKVLIIVGNEVSISATTSVHGRYRAASWRGLIEEGIDFLRGLSPLQLPRRWDTERLRAGLDGKSSAPILDVAAELEKNLRSAGENIYADWLDRTLGGLVPPPQREVLDALGALGMPLATTNYDGLLEYALKRQAITFRDHAYVKEFLEGSLWEHSVLHLHGHFRKPSSVILAIPSYGKILSELQAQDTMRNIFSHRDVVFIGMGLGLAEPNFGKLLDWAAELPIPTERQHFLLVRECDVPLGMARLPMTLRMRVLSYGQSELDLPPFLRSLGKPEPLPPMRVEGRPAADKNRVVLHPLRQRLQQTFYASSDFDAFCIDHFASVHRLFTGSMSRTERENLLLAQIPDSQIEEHLLRYGRASPAAAAKTSTLVVAPSPKRSRAAWSALLQLDRDHQYGKLILGTAQARTPNRLVILHGRTEQNVALFVSRVEEFFCDDVRCDVVTVPMVQNNSRAVSANMWGLHLKCALEAHLGESHGTLSSLLAQAVEHAPLLISLVSNENPLHVLGDLSEDQVRGLKEFLTVLLPKYLPVVSEQVHPISVLLSIEYEGAKELLVHAARAWAEEVWHGPERVHTVLPELKMPSWDEVEDYLRTYRPPLPNLSVVLAEARSFHEERSTRSAVTFEQLARGIDNIIIKHG